MLRRATSPTYAFCASLVVHAGIVFGLTISYIHTAAKIYLAGFVVGDAGQVASIVPPTPDSDPRDTPLGEMTGAGHSIDPVDADRPQEARRGEQAQLFLSRDPAGPGEIGNPPSMSLLPQGKPAVSIRESEAADAAAMIGVPVPPPAYPQMQAHGPAEAQPQATAMTVPASPMAHVAQQPIEQPAATAPPADPAPMAESETDPFSVADGARFIRGRETAQFGRKHKLVRPQLTLAGQSALLQLPSPILIVLRLHLDAAGNVTRAEIARTSGSVDIDQPCKVAAYQWWLEPTRDKAGNPIADVVPFVIRFD